MTPSQKA